MEDSYCVEKCILATNLQQILRFAQNISNKDAKSNHNMVEWQKFWISENSKWRINLHQNIMDVHATMYC